MQRLDDITVCCSIESQWQSATNCNVITSCHIIDCFISSKTCHCYQAPLPPSSINGKTHNATTNRSSRSGTLVRVAGCSDATLLPESLMSLEWTFSFSTDDLPNLSSIEFLRSQGSICLVVTTSAPITSLVANGKKHHMLMCGTVVVVLHLSAPLSSYGVQQANARRPQLSLSPGTPITGWLLRGIGNGRSMLWKDSTTLQNAAPLKVYGNERQMFTKRGVKESRSTG